MNQAVQDALAKVRAMIKPRELTAQQRASLIALRASLSNVIRAANEADSIIESSLQGLMPGVNASGIFSAMSSIDRLLADDRRARQVRP